MAYSEVTRQAISGLQEYKQALINAHQNNVGAIANEEIRSHLSAEGVLTATPLITIPYTTLHLEKAAELAVKNSWTDPFTAGRINKALSKRRLVDQGHTVYEAGFPTPFYSTVLDLAVVFNDTDLNAARFGETYAYGTSLFISAHEITHSAFAKISQFRYKKVTAERVSIQAKYGISQATETLQVWQGGGWEDDYQPLWLDEAFAQHMSAKVRAAMLPYSIPKKPRVFNLTEYQAGEVEVPPKYLIYSDEFPEHPGTLASVESIGIDILAQKRPWLLPQIKAVSRGALKVADLHQNILDGVGRELYSEITRRQPYTTWGRILSKIVELD